MSRQCFSVVSTTGTRSKWLCREASLLLLWSRARTSREVGTTGLVWEQLGTTGLLWGGARGF